MYTNDGTTGSTADTGVTPALNTPYRCRLEIHRSGSPYGACVRLFINGALTSKTTNLPITPSSLGNDLYWWLLNQSYGTGNIAALECGPIRFSMNQGVTGALTSSPTNDV